MIEETTSDRRLQQQRKSVGQIEQDWTLQINVDTLADGGNSTANEQWWLSAITSVIKIHSVN